VRGDPLEVARAFFEAKAESALALTGLALALLAWRRGWIGPAAAAGAATTIAAGIFVLSQNAQRVDIPLYGVIAFLLYGMAARTVERRPGALSLRSLTAVVLIFPALSVAATAGSLIGYYRHAAASGDAFVVVDTNLRGLAVPSEPPRLLDAFADGLAPRHLLNDVRRLRVRYELSQFEYLRTIVDATAMLAPADALPRTDADGPRILVLDSVNPLPFALGLPPPRGGDLWIGSGMPWRGADEVFADVDVVMIPKFPSDAAVLSEAIVRYGGYLGRHFTRWRETRYWIALARAAPASLPEPGRAGAAGP
jgi:hypothetical protein